MSVPLAYHITNGLDRTIHYPSSAISRRDYTDDVNTMPVRGFNSLVAATFHGVMPAAPLYPPFER
jgi:hypothetical protein